MTSHVMSSTIPEAARPLLCQWVQEAFGYPLQLLFVDVDELLEKLEQPGLLLGIQAKDIFEALTGVRPESASAFTFMASDDPHNSCKLPGFYPRRFRISDNQWWLDPNASLHDALAA